MRVTLASGFVRGAVLGRRGLTSFWDLRTGKPLTEPLTHQDSATMAVFSPDGTRVVTVSDNHSARVWDARTGKPLSDPLTHQARVTAAAFSPDGTRVVTASFDHTARIKDARTGKPITEPLTPCAIG